MSLPKVGAVVLHYKQRAFTLACLESMRKLTYPNLEVVLVDNASRDGVAAEVRAARPDVVVVELPENTGFTGGMNAGIVEAARRGAELVYVLNNDTLYPDPKLVDKLVAAFQSDPRVGLAGSKVVDYDNPDRVQWTGPEVVPIGRHDVPGCAFMCRVAMLREIGLLDTLYFTYYEETDLFVRSQRRGWKGVYVEDAVIQHMRGSPSSGDWSPFKAYLGARNFYIFARKNAKGVGGFLRMFWTWNVDNSAYTAKMILKHRKWKALGQLVKGQIVGFAWLFRRLPPEPRLPEG